MLSLSRGTLSLVSNALVTVILPAKDAAPYIGTTLSSLLQQFSERGRLQIVAINDGSTDETGTIMTRFADAYDNVQVVSNTEPRGLASARNQGLRHVDGDYFCFVDGDDWMQPGRLRVLADRMRELECDFVRTDHVQVTGARRQLMRAPYPWRETRVDARSAILPTEDTTMVDYPYAWAGMFHRRLVDEGLALFPEGLFTAEDRPWIWGLHLGAASFAVVDAPALLYRRGVATSLTQIFDRRQLDFIRAFDQTIDIVSRDREADRFLPKIAATTLAVSAHHLVRSREMPGNVRRDLRVGIRGLVRRFPPEVLENEFARMSDRRRRILAAAVREARSA